MSDATYKITYFYEGEEYKDLIVSNAPLQQVFLNFYMCHRFITEGIAEYNNKTMHVIFNKNEIIGTPIEKIADERLDFLYKRGVIVLDKGAVVKFLLEYPDVSSTLGEIIDAVKRELPVEGIYVESYGYDGSYVFYIVVQVDQDDYSKKLKTILKDIQDRYSSDLICCAHRVHLFIKTAKEVNNG